MSRTAEQTAEDSRTLRRAMLELRYACSDRDIEAATSAATTLVALGGAGAELCRKLLYATADVGPGVLDPYPARALVQDGGHFAIRWAGSDLTAAQKEIFSRLVRDGWDGSVGDVRCAARALAGESTPAPTATPGVTT